MPSDDRLVAAVRRGDRAAFEVIFDRHHRALLSFCRHMLGVREEAEDAVQETFIAAYRDLRRSATRQVVLKPWLYAIARNQCLSRLRGRRPSAALEDAELATDGLAGEVQRREDLRQMLADIKRLPEDQRAALVLAELGALSYGEIAQVIGCPPAKVKALVFQARTSLSADRSAREAPCSAVRQQLSTLTGSSLRRTELRRHVRQCAACREFAAGVQRQRTAMAILLPVVPSAGLREGVLGGVAANAGGGAAAAAGSSSLVAAGGGVGAGKLVVAGIAAVVGIGGAAAVIGGGKAPASAGDDPPAPPASRDKGAAVGRGGGGPSQARGVAPVAGSTGHGSRGVGHEAGAPAAWRSSGTGARVGSSGRSGAAAPRPGLGAPSRSAKGRGERSKSKDGSRPSSDRTRADRPDTSSGKKGNRGRSDSAPGHTGDTPGQSGQTPANGAPPPGRAGNTPGKSGKAPGKPDKDSGGPKGKDRK